MLDAARDLLLDRGSSKATVDAIAAATGAPTGTIYHRFGSRDGMIARLWMRAVHRSQAAFVAALEAEDATEAAVAAGLSIVDFCEEHPADARLLVSFRREDLIRTAPDEALAAELEQLNRPVQLAVKDLTRRLYRSKSRAALSRTMMVVFDLPYGAARRHLLIGERLPRELRGDLEAALRAVLSRPLPRAGG